MNVLSFQAAGAISITAHIHVHVSIPLSFPCQSRQVHWKAMRVMTSYNWISIALCNGLNETGLTGSYVGIRGPWWLVEALGVTCWSCALGASFEALEDSCHFQRDCSACGLRHVLPGMWAQTGMYALGDVGLDRDACSRGCGLGLRCTISGM